LFTCFITLPFIDMCNGASYLTEAICMHRNRKRKKHCLS